MGTSFTGEVSSDRLTSCPGAGERHLSAKRHRDWRLAATLWALWPEKTNHVSQFDITHLKWSYSPGFTVFYRANIDIEKETDLSFSCYVEFMFEIILQVNEAEPSVMWLSGLHIPESYLTALVQATCRKNGWPLDKSTLYTNVTHYINPEDVTERTSAGKMFNLKIALSY